MSYFEDVYLKRINKNGINRRDRIKSRKEIEFDRLFLKQTEYLVSLYRINEQATDIKASLQPNNWNESNLISNLLISTSAAPLKTGDILYIKQQIKNQIQDKIWLVVFVEENLTKGYQLFKIICLNDNINITDEYGTSIYSTPVKFVNSAQSFMQDTIIRNAHEAGYREPQTTRILVTQDNEELKKGIYFEYKNRGWEIVGKDNISINNVAYLYISERLLSPPEPQSSEDILVGEDENFFLIGR